MIELPNKEREVIPTQLKTEGHHESSHQTIYGLLDLFTFLHQRVHVCAIHRLLKHDKRELCLVHACCDVEV